MNKTLQTLLCLCAAAVVFGSCQKDEEKTVTTLNISIADSYTPNETNAKVVLDGITPKFEEGDQIWISGYPYTVNSDGTTVTGSGAETPYYAVFPYDEDMGEISGAFPTITLPTEQPYVSLENDEHGNPIQKINAPMWAYAAAGEVGGLSFHNACALLRVRVRNNMGMGVFTLKSITVTSTTNDIAGTGTLAYNEETGEYDLTVSGSKTVTLTGLNEAVKENKSSQEYYIYIPSVADETFTIIANGTYSDKTLAEYTQTSLGAVSIEKSQIGKIAQLLDSCDYFYTKPFTVANGRQVYFSPGNLQYQPSSKKFRFASEQYESFFDGSTYGNTLKQSLRSNTDMWIDHFGWGTSGWESGNTYYHPYDRRCTNTSSIGYGYGPTNNSYQQSLVGDYANADWGVYNSIQNGGNTDPAGTWRTLTSTEWDNVYKLNSKTQATVNGVGGLIILPDSWKKPLGITMTLDVLNNVTTNVYNSEAWHLLEKNGAVFLPLTGKFTTRVENDNTASTISSNTVGFYWSSTVNATGYAYSFFFKSTSKTDGGIYSYNTTTKQYYIEDGYGKNLKHYSLSVRLVRDAE